MFNELLRIILRASFLKAYPSAPPPGPSLLFTVLGRGFMMPRVAHLTHPSVAYTAVSPALLHGRKGTWPNVRLLLFSAVHSWYYPVNSYVLYCTRRSHYWPSCASSSPSVGPRHAASLRARCMSLSIPNVLGLAPAVAAPARWARPYLLRRPAFQCNAIT